MNNFRTWGDFDNDSFLDLFVTSTVDLAGGTPSGNRLYRNNGDGSFTRIEAAAPVEYIGNAVGCAWGDYDNDGFIDLFVAYGGVIGQEENALYHNDGNQNSWIKIHCVGTVSNRAAIGAKVRVLASVGGKTVWQLREISGGTGIQQNPLEAHFGLWDATKAETLRVEWPSGAVQDLHDVPARQILTIVELPSLSLIRKDGRLEILVRGGRGLTYDLERTTDLKTWAFAGQPIVNPTNGTAVITAKNPSSSAAFYRAVLRSDESPANIHHISVDAGQILYELIGEGFNLAPPASAQIGYFTYIKGIEPLFVSTEQNAGTALFTYYRDTVTVRTTPIGPLRVVARQGTTTVYLNSAPDADLNNPDSFRSGIPIQVSTFRQQAIIDTVTQTFTIVDEDVITSTSVFSVNGVRAPIPPEESWMELAPLLDSWIGSFELKSASPPPPGLLLAWTSLIRPSFGRGRRKAGQGRTKPGPAPERIRPDWLFFAFDS